MSDRDSLFLKLSRDNCVSPIANPNDAEKALYLLYDICSLVSVLHKASTSWTNPESEGAEYQLYLIKKMLDDANHFVDLAVKRINV